eukprot:CAMPEP_0176284848 /NCGR_PEP_ID=MMETSP0121_2-20121125/52062_1 /TAXON_ID=160619 /ORGANISM="Kryptoperidinium foliaceum, Strain CCMP 1326" /LENGTH=88 /DNA_ID=CAMNT_0017625307 /DNA_START=43 /DNA_END=306 /DNA_ORIENTATION=+
MTMPGIRRARVGARLSKGPQPQKLRRHATARVWGGVAPGICGQWRARIPEPQAAPGGARNARAAGGSLFRVPPAALPAAEHAATPALR